MCKLRAGAPRSRESGQDAALPSRHARGAVIDTMWKKSVFANLPTNHFPRLLGFRLDETEMAVGAMVDDVHTFALGVAEDNGARVGAVKRLDGILDAHGF